MSLPLIDQSGKITQIVGHKYPDFCVLKVDDDLGLIILLPDGTMVPGQVETMMLGYTGIDLVKVNTELHICGFNKQGQDVKCCYITDQNKPTNTGPMNATMLRITLPDGSFLPGEKGFSLLANDGEVVRCSVDLMIGDVIDNDGNSILVREIT